MPVNTAPILGISSAQFDGVDDYVDLPDVTLGSAFTIEAWVNVNTYVNWSRIIELATSGGANNINIALGFEGTSHRPYIAVNDLSTGQPSYAITPNVMSTGVWHHVASVVNGTSGKVYVDGIEAVSFTFSAVSETGLRDDVWIGRSHHMPTSNYTEGAIRDLRIWTDARSAAQISTNMNPADLTDTTNLLAWYPLEDSAASATLLANGTPMGSMGFGSVSSFLPTHYTENATAILLNRELVIADADDANLTGATVTISSGVTTGDLLGFADQNGITGSYAAGVLTLSGTATLAQYQTALRSVAYSSSSDNPTATSSTRTVTWAVTDEDFANSGAGTLSSTGVTTTITVTAVNDAPTLGGITTSTTINDTATATPFSGVTITDVDANNVTVSVTLDTAAKGVFTAASLSASGFTDGGSGVYSLAAGTAAAAQAAILQLVFDPTDNRVAVASTETTTFTIAVNDGTVTTSDNTTTVVSTSVNDAPTLTTVSTLSGATEDTAFTISYATLAAAANEADVDLSSTLSFRVDAVSSGTLTKGGSAVTPGTTLLSSGESLVWTPAANANGSALNAFTVKASDGTAVSSTAIAVNVNVAAVNNAPTGSVTISGTATQGQTLTASNTLADVDGLGTISYQWKAGGNAIGGATSSTLVLAEAQVGQIVTVTASYTDGGGTGESSTSSATSAVANTNDAPTGSVTISGTPTQGQTLTAANTLADADGLGAINYQWKAGGSAISGATSSTLVLAEAQVGKAITVTASYTDLHSTVETKTSNATSAVVNVNDAPTGDVTITGNATQGQTLTASSTLADLDGLGTISYQWSAGGSPIGGATSSTLVLAEAQVGKTIKVTASYADLHGTAETKTSSTTAAVVNVNDPPTGNVTISGTATQGQTLTAANTLADIDGLGTIRYQWNAGGSPMDGATSSTLVLAEAQVGKAISLTASYTDGHSTAETKTSSTTSAVVNVNDPPVGLVSIVGNAVVGSKLIASNTLKDADGLGVIKYQWMADGVAIAGETAPSFVLANQQIGKIISVSANYVDDHATKESVSSGKTLPVLGGSARADMAVAGLTINEADASRTASIKVILDTPAVKDSTVSYSIVPLTAGAPRDFHPQTMTGQISFVVGEQTQTISIAIVNDKWIEPADTFEVKLTDSSGVIALGDLLTTVVTIKDDDTTTSASGELLANWGLSNALVGFNYEVSLTDTRAKINLYDVKPADVAGKLGLSGIAPFLSTLVSVELGLVTLRAEDPFNPKYTLFIPELPIGDLTRWVDRRITLPSDLKDAFIGSQTSFLANNDGWQLQSQDSLKVGEWLATVARAIGGGTKITDTIKKLPDISTPRLEVTGWTSSEYKLVFPGVHVDDWLSAFGLDTISSNKNSWIADVGVTKDGISAAFQNSIKIDLTAFMPKMAVGVNKSVQSFITQQFGTLFKLPAGATTVTLEKPAIEAGKDGFSLNAGYKGGDIIVMIGSEGDLLSYTFSKGVKLRGFSGDGFSSLNPWITSFTTDHLAIASATVKSETDQHTYQSGITLGGSIALTDLKAGVIKDFFTKTVGIKTLNTILEIGPKGGISLTANAALAPRELLNQKNIDGQMFVAKLADNDGTSRTALAFKVAFDPTSKDFALSASTTLKLQGYDFSQSSEPTLYLDGELGQSSEGSFVSFSFDFKDSPNSWKNPFGLNDVNVKFVAAAVTNGVPTALGLELAWKNKAGQWLDMEAAVLILEKRGALIVKEKTSLSDLWDLAKAVLPQSFKDVMGTPMQLLDYMNVKVVSTSSGSGDNKKFAPLISFIDDNIELGGRTYKSGYGINGQIEAWGKTGTLVINANPDFSKVEGDLTIQSIDLGAIALSGVKKDSDLTMHLSASQSAPGDAKLSGNVKVTVFENSVSQATFEISPTGAAIKDFSSDFGSQGLLLLQVPNFKIALDNPDLAGSGTLKLLGQSIAGTNFHISNSSVTFRANLGIQNIIQIRGENLGDLAKFTYLPDQNKLSAVGYVNLFDLYDVSGASLAISKDSVILKEGSTSYYAGALQIKYQDVTISTSTSTSTGTSTGAASGKATATVGPIGLKLGDASFSYDQGKGLELVGKSQLTINVAGLSVSVALDVDVHDNDVSANLKTSLGDISTGDIALEDFSLPLVEKALAKLVAGYPRHVFEALLKGLDPRNAGSFVFDQASAFFSDIEGAFSSVFGNKDKVWNWSGTDAAEDIGGSENSKNDQFFGNGGNDKIFGAEGDDLIDGGTGDDDLRGGVNNDTINGGDGNDTISGGNDSDKLYGGAGEDKIDGDDDDAHSNDNDFIDGGSGNDTINGRYGNDTINGGSGNDTIYGDRNVFLQYGGNDVIDGGSGDDVIYGASFNDTINGGDGNDTMYGDFSSADFSYTAKELAASGRTAAQIEGNDVLEGGLGKDTLTGGLGVDTFVYRTVRESPFAGDGWDTITDFSPGDKIDLSNIDANVKTLAKENFTFIGSASFSAAGQLRFDPQTHMLYANVNNDLTADFAILLTGVASMINADFVGVLL